MSALQQLGAEQILTLVAVFASIAVGGLWGAGRIVTGEGR